MYKSHLYAGNILARPSLRLAFAADKSLPGIVTFTRASSGTYFDASGVMQTASTNVARFTHDPATGQSLGLLIEESRTNLLTYSEEFDDAAWTKTGCSISANATAAPDGNISSDAIVEDSSSGQHLIAQSFSGLASTTYTLSIYVKSSGRSVLISFGHSTGGVQAAINLSTASAISGYPVGTGSDPLTSVSQDVEYIGNGVYRFSCTGTFPASASSGFNVSIQCADANGSPPVNVYTGDGTSGIYIWGAQLEAGSFPTSYIKTTSSTATRAADSASITGSNFSSWYTSTAGTLVIDITPAALSAGAGVVINDNTTNNRLRLSLTSVSDQATVTTGGVAQAVLDGGTPAAETRAKVALSYKANDFALSLNGGTVAADASGSVPAVTQMQIGAETTTTGNVTIRSVSFYPLDLSDSYIKSLTA